MVGGTSKDIFNFETFTDSGEDRFILLDLLKLPTSLSVTLKEANNEVTTAVAQKEYAAFQDGGMLMGRQIAWLIFTNSKANLQMGVMYVQCGRFREIRVAE